MNDKMREAIEKDIKSGASFFYFSDNANLASFNGCMSDLLTIIVPSIYKIISSGNITIDNFAKLLSVYEKMKNEDE